VTTATTNGARVVREPHTYEPLGWSYFGDLALAEHPERERGHAARERLLRHEHELRTETRAPSYSYADPPRWLVEEFAIFPRPDRILAGLIEAAGNLVEIPQKPGFSSVNVPRLTAGTKTAVDVPDSVTPDADVTTGLTPGPAGSAASAGLDPERDPANVGGRVVQIAGQEDVPLQMLEQSGPGMGHLDRVLWKDLNDSVDSNLELQLVNGPGGAGPFGQLLGLLNVTGTNSVVYTDASPTVAKFIQTASPGQGGPAAQAIAAIGNNRRRKPEVWLMTTSRAAWITSGEVTFPLALANQIGPGEFDMLSYPAIEVDAIPTTLGVGGNQDVVVACRPSDMLLFESAGVLNAFTEVISSSLEARVQLRRYVAAVLGRWPTGISVISGTGMIVQANF